MDLHDVNRGGERKFKQRFTGIGRVGAALFVAAPVLAGAMLATSVPAYYRELASRYSSRPQDELYSPWVYLVLLLVSLTGFVMIVIGREWVEFRSPATPSQAEPHRESSSAELEVMPAASSPISQKRLAPAESMPDEKGALARMWEAFARS